MTTSRYFFLKVKDSILVTVNLICEYLSQEISHYNNKWHALATEHYPCNAVLNPMTNPEEMILVVSSVMTKTVQISLLYISDLICELVHN
jgi:hypothetical protein